jgi:hypothetical protein
MKVNDVLMLSLIILLYAGYNIFANIIVSQNSKLSQRLKIIIGILTWFIPVMAGIIIIQRYYPSKKKQAAKSGKKGKGKKKKK